MTRHYTSARQRPKVCFRRFLCPHKLEGATVKVRASLRSIKNQKGAQVVKRKGRIYVINKTNPRMKARQK